MTAYRWVGNHDYRDHAHGRVIEPGEELPTEIAERVARAHPHDVDEVTTTTHDDISIDVLIEQTAAAQVDAIEAGELDDHLAALEEANDATNGYATVDDAIERRRAELG